MEMDPIFTCGWFGVEAVANSWPPRLTLRRRLRSSADLNLIAPW